MLDDRLTAIPHGNAAVRTLWQSHDHPASLHEERDMADDENHGFYNPDGSLIRVVDVEPRSEGFSHRTASLDYGIVLQGAAELVLEDGPRTVCRAGDVVVQRAVSASVRQALRSGGRGVFLARKQTMHRWDNPNDEPARIIFVLLPAKPMVVDGVEMGDFGLPRPPGMED